MKNIVIVGGGSAGWLTALYAKKIYQEDNIILVESEEYGILGAGEGSTPNIIGFMNFLDISVEDLIKNCNATIKNGIKFTNWSEKEDSYFHPFQSINEASNDYNFYLNSRFIENDTNFSHYCASLNDHEFKDYVFVEKFSNNFQVPYLKENNPISMNQLSNISIHFDANLLAKYLRLIGESRGILRKEGIVSEISEDLEGYINKIKTNKEEISCDFVFDCSGFRRLIIGKHYKIKWKSYSKYLPAKKALPFFLEIDKDIPPYTEAIAMDYGWMWKIPLQNRYGCGYVFDSDFISDEEAKKEIENYLGFEPIYPRKDKGAFNFEAGCFEEVWNKNCLAVGLSSGFLEPLEATSIMQLITVLTKFMSNKQNLTTKNNLVKKRFNDMYLEETQEIVNFLYLHYVTNKINTSFWKNFTKNNEMPEEIKYILSVCKDKTLFNDFDFYKNKIFSAYSYHYILIGNKIIDNVILKRNANFILDNIKKENYKNILRKQDFLIPKLLTHNYFIDTIKQWENND
jgi:tryptophan halogenase